MQWRGRKIRIAIVLAIAVVAAVVAWRTNQAAQAPCRPERIEEKDASGAIVKITRKECAVAQAEQ